MFGFGGQNTADAKIRVGFDGKEAKSGLTSLRGAIGAVVSVYAIKQIATYAKDLAMLGATAMLVEKNFSSFAESNGRSAGEMMKKMRSATLGMVSDMELQQKGMKAMISGVSFDDMIVAMEYVTRYAAATGDDVNQKMTSTMTGFARKSAQFLDDVGIQVMGSKDVIGDAVAQMKEKMGEFTLSEDDAAVQAAQLKSELSNLGADAGKFLVPALTLATKALRANIGAYSDLMDLIGGKSVQMIKFKKAMEIASGKGEDGISELFDLRGKAIEQRNKIIAQIDVANRLGKDSEKFKKELTDIDNVVKMLTGSMNDLTNARGGSDPEKPKDSFVPFDNTKFYALAQANRDRFLSETEDFNKKLKAEQERSSQDILALQEQYQLSALTDNQMRLFEQSNTYAEFYNNGIITLEEYYEKLRELGIEYRLTESEEEQKNQDDILAKKKENIRKTYGAAHAGVGALQSLSTAYTNSQINEANRSAKTQEELDKRTAQIQSEAAQRSYQFALFDQILAIAQAGVNIGVAASESAAHGAAEGGLPGAIISGIGALAELAVIMTQIQSTNVPPPSFELGGLYGGLSRGRGMDNVNAIIGNGEYIMDAGTTSRNIDSLEAMRNNTFGGNGQTTMNIYGLNADQVVAIRKDTERRKITGTLI